MGVAVIGIDYDELSPTTYRGVTLWLGSGINELRFYGNGAVQKDLDAAVAKGRELGARLLNSSSVDNFEMDGGDLSAPYV